MHLRALLPDFARHLAARGAATRTTASYTRTLEAFFEHLGQRLPAPPTVEAFLARPGRRVEARSSSTKRAELIALRAFFAFASPQDAADPTDGIAIRRGARTEPVVAMPADIPRLFDAAARSAEGPRDLALLGLFFVLGLRLHEVVQLDVEQVDLVARVLWRVCGKGGVVVDLPIPARLETLLAAWLRVRAMRGHPDSGPLFPTARPTSSRTGRLSARSLQRAVGRLCSAAGLAKQLGPHALRHGCATAAISLGVDVPTTAAALRHSSIATTQAYVHLAGDARRCAYDRISSLIPPSIGSPAAPAASPAANTCESGRLGASSSPVDFHHPVNVSSTASRTQQAGEASRSRRTSPVSTAMTRNDPPSNSNTERWP